MVATHNLIVEDEFFDADEFVVIEDIVDDVFNTLYPDSIVSIANKVHISNITRVKQNLHLL
jgi:hypothetical protein